MSGSDAEALAIALGGRQQGDGWISRCPAHDDRTPSLSIHDRDGRILVHCHAGCDQDAVIEALRRRGLWPPSGSSRPAHSRRIVATYNYEDETRELLFQVLRYDPKDFRVRRPDGKGGFVYNLHCVRRVLYRLPDLLERPDDPLFVVEGEKDADALSELGLLATTNSGGAEKWTAEYTEALRERDVRVIPDRDRAGDQHAQRVAREVALAARAVRIVQLPGLREGGDVSDWLEAGGTVAELERLASASDPIRAETTPEAECKRGEGQIQGPGTFADQLKRERVRFVWPGRLAFGKTHLLVGDPEQLKTTWALRIAADLSQGRPLPGTSEQPAAPMASVILTWEDGASDTIVGRLIAAGADLSRILIVEEDLPSIPDDLSAIERAVARAKARTRLDVGLVVIDPLAAALGARVDSRNNSSTRRALSPLKILAQRLDVAILLIDHLNKNANQAAIHRATGSIAFMAAARVALLVGPDPTDTERDPVNRRRALVRLKGNIGPPPPALLYRRETVAMSEDPSDTEVTIEVTGEAAISPDQLLGNFAAKAERSGAADPNADDLLIDILAKGPRPIEIVHEAAQKAGLTKSALNRAKRSLRIVTKKRDDGTYFWSLPDDAQRVTDELVKTKNARRAEEKLAALETAIAHLADALISGPMIKEAAISSLMAWGATRAFARQAVEWEQDRWHLERAGRAGGGSLVRLGPQRDCQNCHPSQTPVAGGDGCDTDTGSKFAEPRATPASGLDTESANLNGGQEPPKDVPAAPQEVPPNDNPEGTSANLEGRVPNGPLPNPEAEEPEP